MVRRSAPFSSKWVAKQCLRVRPCFELVYIQIAATLLLRCRPLRFVLLYASQGSSKQAPYQAVNDSQRMLSGWLLADSSAPKLLTLLQLAPKGAGAHFETLHP
jgi:hypothetical protein